MIKNIKINFTFLNLVNNKNMLLRLSKRRKLNRYDKFDKIFYKKVQDGYIKLANNDPNKYMKIDSNLDINFNKKLILSKINKLI